MTDYIQDTIDDCTNIIYSGAATQRSDLDAVNDKISAANLNMARTKLEAA